MQIYSNFYHLHFLNGILRKCFKSNNFDDYIQKRRGLETTISKIEFDISEMLKLEIGQKWIGFLAEKSDTMRTNYFVV